MDSGLKIVTEKSKREVLIDFFNNKNNHPYTREELLALNSCFNDISDLGKKLNSLVKDNFLSKTTTRVNGYSKVFYFRKEKYSQRII